MKSFTSSVFVLAATLLDSISAQQASALPQVDLGYEVHQASSYNSSAQLYSFTNIRYAQPPLGDLRFAAPVAPTGRNPDVQNGSVGHSCPQAIPEWILIGEQFTTALGSGQLSTFNYTAAAESAESLYPGFSNTLTDGANEDCLFLDVVVPKAIYDSANRTLRRRASAGAPVLVWIYGGGYTLGSKDSYNPAGLIGASQSAGGPGVVYVAMNYRLGAMGWLSGPSFQRAGGVANAALYDQRLALEWVHNNIHLFGGDPNQVTIVGESAGGGSIMHQITAFGGQRGVHFQRAVPQSPGWVPLPGQNTQELTYNAFLKALNVSTLAEARNASTADVVRANSNQVAGSFYGSFTYGPAVDGVFAPALPGISLLNGAYAKNVSIMAGHNFNEGALFTAPNITSEADIRSFFTFAFPAVPQSVVDYVLNTLYPPTFDGSQGYITDLGRTMRIITEWIFTCNTNYLATGYKNQTYNYEFQVPPAFHGDDISYTFYNGPATGIVATVATALQKYITNFVQTGNPNSPAAVPDFPMQGRNASMQGLNVTSISPRPDDTANDRCAWWQLALYS